MALRLLSFFYQPSLSPRRGRAEGACVLNENEEADMRLTGFAAIEFAEKQNLPLLKKGDHIDQTEGGLTIAEAEAIAAEDENLIYLDVPDELYYEAPPTSFEPER